MRAKARVAQLLRVARGLLAGSSRGAPPLGRQIAAVARRRAGRDELGGLTKAELYELASRLSVPGRSRMDRAQLVAAIRRARARGGSFRSLAASFRAGIVPLGVSIAGAGRAAGRLASSVRALPTRSLILSLVMLAACVFGVVVAYAVASPQQDVTALGGNQVLRVETVTGRGGTQTLVVTKSKGGKVERIPVDVVRTVTGTGGRVRYVVAGASTAQTVRQIHEITETQVVTNVEAVTEVVTSVVTQPETVVVTETVVIEVTTTVPPGQGNGGGPGG